MSQLPKIPASAYTPEMKTLGVISDITTFEGEWVPVSRNALTPGTRPLQLLPLPGTEFPVRHETSAMRGFQTELRHAGRSCVTQLFLHEQLRVAAVLGEQLREATVRSAMNPSVSELGGFAPLHNSSVTRLFVNEARPWIVEWHSCSSGCNVLNSCMAQLFLRRRNLGKLRDAAVHLGGATLPDHSFLSWLITYFIPNAMVFQFEDSEVTATYEEMCAMMDHHPEQGETPALPPGPRYDLTEIVALCPVYLPDGINTDQGLPLEPFLNKLSLIPPVPTHLIPTYGPANFRSRSRGHFDFGDNPVIRWPCPWWRIRLVTAGSMNLNYVLYANLDSSMAYFLDRISRQYGMIQRVPKIHNFESGLMTQSLLINLADRWQNRNTWYLGQGVMQDTMTPEYVNWFYTK
ncbi:hypothetical protein JCGZ_24407 [Jatropha curcas]|uniref:Aminotransferase-like plant mobile domain-containing protein n=1 Tax=Jatropha curcas TaxID=180498 RepID=A0A067JZN7_JATCU|nr:hypothetical protein JCGZ_24407 [Jatropha curcas]